MKNIMIDIETLDNIPGGAILQIAAIQFDIETGNIEEQFAVNVSLNSCLKVGLGINEDTFKWWMHQSDEARKLLFDPKPSTLESALCALARFITNEDTVWCHSSFDIPCLDVAYRATNIGRPWRYSKVRDLRTFFDDRKFSPKTDMPEEETDIPHNALSDCARQIRQMIAAKTKAGF